MRNDGQPCHHPKWCSFAPAKSINLVHFCSGAWCSFTPALTLAEWYSSIEITAKMPD